MTTSTLRVGFSNASSASDNYWLKIESAEQTDTVGKDEIAEVIDALYDIATCGDNTPEPDTEQTGELPFDEKDFQNVIKDKLDPSFCSGSYDGSYKAQIKIWKSHQDEPYRLRLSNGIVGGTVRKQETVVESVVINGGDTVQMLMPVVGNITALTLPAGFGGMSAVGSVFTFGEEVNGSASFSYQTEYDLVDIIVNGVDGKPGNCMVLGFYHGLVVEHEVTPPSGLEEDWLEREKYCGAPSINLHINDREDDITCFEEVTYQYKCNCSTSVAYEDKLQVIVPCPESLKQCTTGLFSDAVWHSDTQTYSCSSYLGSRTVLGDYVDCGESDAKELGNPENYVDKCCHDPNHSLPKCRETYTKNKGGKTIDQDTYNALMAEWEGRVEFIGISPEDNNCGTTKTVVSSTARNCCTNVDPIIIDEDESGEVVANYSNIAVVIDGGTFPKKISVKGTGFYLDSQGQFKDKVYSSGNTFIIYTLNACGPATVTITDGCTEVKHTIRATTGQWVRTYVSGAGIYGDGVTPAYPGGCPVMGIAPERHPHFTGRDRLTVESGMYKIEQTFGSGSCYGQYAARSTLEEANSICAMFAAQTCLPSSGYGNEIGSCFTAVPKCHECGECTNDANMPDPYDWINFSMGGQSIYRLGGWVPYLIYYSRTYVYITEVYEWRC